MDTNTSKNKDLYADMWKAKKLKSHTFWITWSKYKDLIPKKGGRLLDIGCGMRPRIPVKGSHFFDISTSSFEVLRAHGGICQQGDVVDMPYKNETFDFVNASELLEHIKEDEKAFSEVFRILKKGGCFGFSVPMGMKYWSKFDDMVHHARRYEAQELLDKMQKAGFELRYFYSNKPSKSKVYKNLAALILKYAPGIGLWVEENITLPIAEKFQKNSGREWHTDGFVEKLQDASGVIAICQKPK